MRSSAGGSDADRRVPRLAPGWEAEATALNPAEGFLLSRIDGHTPWAVLRQIGGLLPEEVDLALEGWVKSGLVLLDTAPERPVREAREAAGGAPAAASSPQGNGRAAAGPDPTAAVDPTLDIAPEFQTRILEFDAGLSRAGYHEILGVGRGASAREIKRAYFQLSKQFHPDRYFRRNVGGHAARLDRIFKHVALAYELLSDPATREEIERSMAASPEAGAYRQRGAGAEAPAGDAPPGGYRVPTRMENLERLRNRFKMPKKVLAERRFKARQFYQSARAAAHQKSWLEAAASARLAIAFDPWNPDYKDAFASIQAEVHALRASELLERAEGAGAEADALKLIEEAIHYRPADAALHARAAALALDVNSVAEAREFAESACELEPERAPYHVLRSRALRRTGNAKAAEEALEMAAQIAPGDPDVVAEQRAMRRSRRR